MLNLSYLPAFIDQRLKIKSLFEMNPIFFCRLKD